MKVTFNLGAVSINMTKPSYDYRLDKETIEAQRLQNVQPLVQSVAVTLEASSYTFDCEPTELPEIYKVVMPALTDLVKMLAVLKK